MSIPLLALRHVAGEDYEPHVIDGLAKDYKRHVKHQNDERESGAPAIQESTADAISFTLNRTLREVEDAYPVEIREELANKREEEAKLKDEYKGQKIKDKKCKYLWDACEKAYNNAAKRPDDAKLEKVVEKARQAITDRLESKPDDDLKNKLEAFDRWRKASEEADKLGDLTPKAVLKDARLDAKQALKKIDEIESYGQKIESLRTSLQDVSGMKTTLDEVKSAVNSAGGTKASPEDIATAKKEARKKLYWALGIVSGLLTTATIVSTCMWVKWENKTHRVAANATNVINTLLAQQNQSPDESQGGPPPPSYPASQAAYGGSPPPYGPPPPYSAASPNTYGYASH